MIFKAKKETPPFSEVCFLAMCFSLCTFTGLALRAKLFEHERHPFFALLFFPSFWAGVVLALGQKKETPPFGDVSFLVHLHGLEPGTH